MGKYSSKYIGDKLYSYVSYEEYLLRKLMWKIYRKYHSDKQFDKHYYAFSKGYYTSKGFNKKYNLFKEDYVVENELYEDSYFYDGVLTYSMLPCVYFDFPYVTEILYPYMKVDVSPSDVTDRLMDVAMVKNNPIVIEDLRHSSNLRFFRVVIPLSYYSVRKEFYYENKRFKKVVSFEKRRENYLNIYSYLTGKYHNIIMEYDYKNCIAEYTIYYDEILTNVEEYNNFHCSVLKDLKQYCTENNLINEYNDSVLLLQPYMDKS